jgi:hypothetical protein
MLTPAGTGTEPCRAKHLVQARLERRVRLEVVRQRLHTQEGAAHILGGTRARARASPQGRSARIYGDLRRAGLRRGADPGQRICTPSGSTSASARSGGAALDPPLRALRPALGSAWSVYQQPRLCSVRT